MEVWRRELANRRRRGVPSLLVPKVSRWGRKPTTFPKDPEPVAMLEAEAESTVIRTGLD